MLACAYLICGAPARVGLEGALETEAEEGHSCDSMLPVSRNQAANNPADIQGTESPEHYHNNRISSTMAEPIPINFPVPLWVVMEYIAPDNYDKGPIYSKAIGAFTEETSVTRFLDNLFKHGAHRFESQPISGVSDLLLFECCVWYNVG